MIRAAVVGVGYLGRFHAQKYKGLADTGQGVQLIGVYDANRERAQVVAAELGVKVFQSLEEVVKEVVAVTIASNTQTHFEIAKYFLSQKIHVNVEKPMTVTAGEAMELVALADKNQVKLSVGHSERFNPVYQFLQKQFPQPQFLHLCRYAPFRLRGSDVSVVLDLMVHDLDMVVNWSGGPLQLVRAVGGRVHSETLDWAECQLVRVGANLDTPSVYQISVSRVACAMTRSIRGVSKQDCFLADFQSNEVELLTWERGQENPTKKETVKIEKKDHLLLETQAFLAAVAGRSPLVVPGVQGAQVLELALEIEASIVKPVPSVRS